MSSVICGPDGLNLCSRHPLAWFRGETLFLPWPFAARLPLNQSKESALHKYCYILNKQVDAQGLSQQVTGQAGLFFFLIYSSPG